jgi:ankyrin repeat protein
MMIFDISQIVSWHAKSTDRMHKRSLGISANSHNAAMPLLLLPPSESFGKAAMCFLEAAVSGNLEEVQRLYISHGGDIVNAQSYWTALHCASWNGNLKVIKYLVETCGADIHAVDTGGNTPLHDATAHAIDMLEVVKYFVEIAGADINAVNTEGDTPLHCACKCGKLDDVQYLVEVAGANIHTVDNKGNTMLHDAISNGELELVKYSLVEKCSANILAVNGAARTPLHIAYEEGLEELVVYLVDRLPTFYVQASAHVCRPSDEA